jgi:hypothetical protein
MSCRRARFPGRIDLSKLAKSLPAAAALALALALALPPDAGAGSSDADYCTALGDLYLKYVFGTPRAAPLRDMSGLIAISQCASGDTESGIPVLEEKLRSNKFTLPGR